MKKKKINLFPVLFAITSVLLLIALIFYELTVLQKLRNNSPAVHSNPVPQAISSYASKSLKLSFKYPQFYTLEEKFTNVVLQNSQNKIIITRVATDFNTVEEYLSNLSKKNKITYDVIFSKKINNTSALKATIHYPTSSQPNQTAYFLFADNWVYTVESTSPTAYTDMEQVVESLRYTK